MYFETIVQITGNMASNFLSVDFEKNSLNSYANFDVSVTLEPIEVMYHEVSFLRCFRPIGLLINPPCFSTPYQRL